MSQSIFSNVVLSEQYDSILTTKLDANQFITVEELPAGTGLTKRVITYTATGDVDDLNAGVGNTNTVEVSYTTKDYTVKTTQGRFVYRDEDAQQDAYAIEAGLEGLAETMANDWFAKAVDEWEDATKTVTYTGSISFDIIVDALGQLNLENEEECFLLISTGARDGFRKSLKDDLKYVEAFSRTGYIGSVAGVPVYVSKALTANSAILATKKAVTAFIAPATEMEQERNANTRTTTVYARRLAVVALSDARKVCLITKSGS